MGQVCAHGRSEAGRPEANFSQGERWKRLISRYIAVMPSIGRILEPDEQSGIGSASFAAIHAMNPKVGDAARASQPAAPRARQEVALPLFAEDVGIVRLLIDLSPFPPVAGSSLDMR
jgi:hypothetical protein